MVLKKVILKTKRDYLSDRSFFKCLNTKAEIRKKPLKI